jgi:ribonuclease P protein component
VLPAPNRLRRREDFAKVYAEGDRHNGKYLRIRIYKAGNSNPGSSTACQIGIVVSKKVSKKAVTRNRIKRQLRAIFRQLLSQLKQGLLIVVVVKAETSQVLLQGKLDYKQFEQDLIKLLIAAQVFHGN